MVIAGVYRLIAVPLFGGYPNGAITVREYKHVIPAYAVAEERSNTNPSFSFFGRCRYHEMVFSISFACEMSL